MKNVILPKGPLKTIRFHEVPQETKPVKARGRRRLVEIETKTRGLEVQSGEEQHFADVVSITGSVRVVSSSEDPRIETYAEVTFSTNEEPFGVFLLSHEGRHAQVLAPSEYVARGMHPTEGFEWDPRKKQWKNDKGELQGTEHFWPAPEALQVKCVGHDEYAEVEERLHYWED